MPASRGGRRAATPPPATIIRHRHRRRHRRRSLTDPWAECSLRRARGGSPTGPFGRLIGMASSIMSNLLRNEQASAPAGRAIMTTISASVGEDGVNKKADVRIVQELLTRAGHDPKGIDGGYGTNTHDAILSFQRT